MDNTGLMRVVVGLAVPLICQLLAAPVGGSSDSRTAYAPLDDLNGTVKNCYVVFLLPPQSTAGANVAVLGPDLELKAVFFHGKQVV